MKFKEYEGWFEEEYSKISVEIGPHFAEIGPFVTPTILPNSPPWQMKWAVIFSDGNFFRITENYFSRSTSLLRTGYRKHFSFTYGPANPVRDADGMPVRSSSYPAIFRIDDDRYGPHLHFGGEDHISQSRVINLRISDVEPFDFVRAVLKHRVTKEGFEKILNFRVTT